MEKVEAKVLISDYVTEYEDFVEVLSQPLKEPVENAHQVGNNVNDNLFRNVNCLFDEPEESTERFFDIEKHWVGMPAFDMNDIKNYKDLVVHFQTQEDMLEFSKKLGIKLSEKTKSIFYPEHEPITVETEVWIDEQEAFGN